MATVDDTIYLKTGETKEMVQDPADQPTAKELMSKIRLNSIKFDSYVWSCIQKTNVYIKQDDFQRNA
eukprot:4739929-Ditylum_brightwellii.AAC.1